MIGDIHHATGHGIRPICVTLRVPRSSYYHAAAPTPTQLSDLETSEVIEAVFNRHRRRYGYRRIWQELQDQGHVCAPDRVRRIMTELPNRVWAGDITFIDGSDARIEIFEYIEAYYNTHRKHSSLGYQTPAQFEAKIRSLN